MVQVSRGWGRGGESKKPTSLPPSPSPPSPTPLPALPFPEPKPKQKTESFRSSSSTCDRKKKEPYAARWMAWLRQNEFYLDSGRNIRRRIEILGKGNQKDRSIIYVFCEEEESQGGGGFRRCPRGEKGWDISRRSINGCWNLRYLNIRSSKARALEDRGNRGIARQLSSKQRPSDCCVNYSKGYNGLNGDAPWRGDVECKGEAVGRGDAEWKLRLGDRLELGELEQDSCFTSSTYLFNLFGGEYTVGETGAGRDSSILAIRSGRKRDSPPRRVEMMATSWLR